MDLDTQTVAWAIEMPDGIRQMYTSHLAASLAIKKWPEAYAQAKLVRLCRADVIEALLIERDTLRKQRDELQYELDALYDDGEPEI